MRTRITSLADALVSASVVLTAAIICAGAAGADPSQQDQFWRCSNKNRFPPSITCLVSSPEPMEFVANSMAAPGRDRSKRRDELCVQEIRPYTYFPIALEEPRSDSSPHQWTSTAQAIKASFRRSSDKHADHDPARSTVRHGLGRSGTRLPCPAAGVVRRHERSLVEDRERSLVMNQEVGHGHRWHPPVGVCRTGEPQRRTEDQDRNGESVPDGECDCVHGFPLNADSGRSRERQDDRINYFDVDYDDPVPRRQPPARRRTRAPPLWLKQQPSVIATAPLDEPEG